MRSTLRRLAPILLCPAILSACGGSDVMERAKVDAPVTIGTGQFEVFNLSAAASQEIAAAVYNDYNAEEVVEQPFVATSTDGLATFGTPTLIDPESPYVAYPHLAALDDGTLLAATTAYNADDSQGWPVLYRSSDRGKTFSKLGELPDAPRVEFTAYGVALAASGDGKTVVLAWFAAPADPADAAISDLQLVASVSTDGGKSFGASQVISKMPLDGWGVEPQPFVTSGGAGVAFIDSVPLPNAPTPTPAAPNPRTTVGVASVAFAASDGTFSAPVRIHADSVPARGAGSGAAVDGDGKVHVAWVGEGAQDVPLWVAAGDSSGFGSPIRVGTVVMPTTETVDVAVDGEGTTWVAAVDGETLRVFRLFEDKVEEIVDAAVTVKVTTEVYDMAGLKDGGVLLEWYDGTDIKVRRIAS